MFEDTFDNIDEKVVRPKRTTECLGDMMLETIREKMSDYGKFEKITEIA